ncbi:unnamed protein product [Spirodela intermedia]|uniref:Uncharacterized protein n=1 Tax=Spirodela intermedia TaxID=51605 RepID=A0A7I8KX56_SPIIN|nr:unnamed protein product [Spirodela intermedia]
MDLPAGDSERPWPPAVAVGATTAAYWLNWRVLVCAFWILSSVTVAAISISRSEARSSGEEEREREEREQDEPRGPLLYEEDTWRPCLEKIHPAWLLGFRVLAFSVLSALLVVNLVAQGGEMFYFYTQWTFALVTLYFGIGSLLSCYGCRKLLGQPECKRPRGTHPDAENPMYAAPTSLENEKIYPMMERCDSEEENLASPLAGFWAHTFQIIFQVSGGAVMLTDCVFWLVIVPFLTAKDYSLDFFMSGMHSMNAIFLLGDTALNSLRFPWFRISYFVLFTAVYVIFQWVIHASTPIWWPYPFLDLSSPYAPLWYFSVGVMHVPCFAIFPLLIKAKHLLLSRWFPQSYQLRKY